jgi:hypothetical protein
MRHFKYCMGYGLWVMVTKSFLLGSMDLESTMGYDRMARSELGWKIARQFIYGPAVWSAGIDGHLIMRVPICPRLNSLEAWSHIVLYDAPSPMNSHK